MIILDTNVLSELMRIQPSASVMAWLSDYGHQDLRTTAVTQAEILFGIAHLPSGRRRQMLEGAAKTLFTRDFSGRILPFDEHTAASYADVFSGRIRQGRPIKSMDAMIVAIARANGAAVATRNIVDFEGCGIVLHDPWRGA